MMEFLASIYLWIKAAHVIFVIFWMAGLFILPRYLVHHQEALGTPEADKWQEREARLRSYILTPSMLLVWLFGLMAATVGQHWTEGWLHTKLLLVILLTGYHGWAVAYTKRLARGEARRSLQQLRLINELPAVFVVLIVLLVVVKPF